jgi:2-oxoglutarate dehydrogenase E1 component
MSPKSLLRHKLAVSNLSEMDANTSFVPVIDEIDTDVKTNNVKKLIFCAGKVYYDLLEERREKKIKNIAIIRLEQLYPFSEDLVTKIVSKYTEAKDFVWCQEEPKNMGAWNFIRPLMDSVLHEAGIKKPISFVGRAEAASPAVGYLYAHNKQQEALVNEALRINPL